MPRNFKRFFASVFLVLVSILIANAQTTADVMRERITKAKAFIAVRNYNAAIYELENIRRETTDPTVNAVINVLLMNSYLEQGDYKRAQDFLTELAKSNKANAAADYMSAAAQVIKGAKNQIERFKSLGLSVSDRNLPLEAATDVEKMRQTLELVIEQSKVLSREKTQTSNAMALLEEASNVRGNLAKDDYDANRWKNESADARESLANSRSVVINADGTTNTVASTTNPVTTTQTTQTSNPTNNPVQKPTTTSNTNPVTTNQPNTQTNNTVANKETTTTNEKPVTETKTNDTNSETTTNRTRDRRAESTQTPNTNPVQTQTVSQVVENNTPLDVGSLIEYAIQQVTPTYPQQARSIRQTGVVRVELIIDEEGKVAGVQKASGPSLLQSAAKDAAKKWRFRPFLRDGQPVKAIGFLSFNFNL